MKGTTVEIRNLLVHILKGWRVILISMLVFAVLLDGLGYVKKSNDAKETAAAAANTEADGASEESQINDQVVAHAASAYRLYQNNYTALKTYLTNSIRMQVDPNAAPIATLEYAVDNHYETTYPVINKKDNSLDIVNSLAVIVKNDENCKKIAQDMGFELDSSYIAELLTTSVTEPDVLNIQILGRTQSECEQMAKVIKQAMDDSVDELKSAYGDFDLHLVAEQYNEKVSIDLLTERQSRISTLDTINKNMNTLINNLTESQKDDFYAFLAEGTDADEEVLEEQEQAESPAAKTAAVSVPVIQKKFLLLGLIFGAAAACFVLGCMYIISGKIHCQSDIEARYEIPVLGTLYVQEDKKKLFGFVDRFIDRFADPDRKKFTDEERENMVNSDIRITAKKQNLSHLYFTGSICENAGYQMEEALAKAAKEASIGAESGKSILYDPESREKLAASDGVILVEYLEKTSVSDMDKEIASIARLEVPVLGCVVLR